METETIQNNEYFMFPSFYWDQFINQTIDGFVFLLLLCDEAWIDVSDALPV